MNIKEKLQTNYHFADQELETSLRYFKPERIQTKSFFLEEGKVSDKLAFVTSGMLRSFVYDDDADEVTTHFFLTGNVLISIDSFNNQVAAKENIVAVEDSELLVISYEEMNELMTTVPVWQQIAKDVDEYKFSEQMKRSIRFQTLSASERYQLLLQKKPEIVQKAPLRHIASYLGMDIATLSRIRKRG
jgi:CRP-like cAMP-binding protein